MSLEGLTSLLREFGDPAATITPAERSKVAAALFKQVQKDKGLSGLLFEKFEAHRKLIRYESRAFNQLHKKSLVKKKTKRSHRLWQAINILIKYNKKGCTSCSLFRIWLRLLGSNQRPND